jgi:hypothetical protein
VNRFPGSARDPRAVIGDPPITLSDVILSSTIAGRESSRRVAANSTRVACAPRTSRRAI